MKATFDRIIQANLKTKNPHRGLNMVLHDWNVKYFGLHPSRLLIKKILNVKE